ncbi:AI-2E family transporter [Paenibacillus sp. FSL R5-0887]|jgi:sporulation integral membrane protein YtvI|uniref:AI-2E family transporter n=1 Tax=Paenibacillus TaxID=44249 RepID=UPI00096DEC50|nr:MULTISPECIES: AI-2E family transporter [Paenibacillus]MDH6426026.1 sporulation integral membrane protein YtvI [Paenibacillus sp. PastH-4]MDH6442048.1 sporulation integral membrane protein YtvI [Paenibacillus sp. PastF-4]MDH6527238.1 sporulation integral membrane protein YtvI [Paenibacillus sp. PastH-3]OMC76157.1 AI-2E family transporter [Paenibacillus odorifer]OMD58604.1 AI-2E family transporter [Paenibacillus odorifer]
MLPLYKKYWRTFFDIGLIVLTVYLIMFSFSKLYQLAAPVFLSFFVFLLIEPLARFLNRRGLGKPFASAISVLLFLIVLLGTLFGAGLLITIQALHFQENLPKYTYVVQQHFVETTTYLQQKIDNLPPDITNKVNGYFKDATDVLTGWLITFLKYMAGILGSFSTFMANFGIAIILAFFLSMEIKDWRKIAHDKMPKTFKNAFAFLQGNVFKAIGSYLKAQLILISITFAIVLVGLFILRTGNEITMALVCAVFDVLPLLGVTTILVPWIIYLFIVGNTSLAIGLIILLAIVLIVRQLLEPKITGNSIGVSSAFLMLSFVILSTSAFGMAGLILSPILLILIKELIQQGYLQSWIYLPQEEFIVSPFAANGPASNQTSSAPPPEPQAPEGTDDNKSNI